MLKRFISYYKPHKKLLAMDLGASFLISVIGMIYPVVTRKMLNEYIPNRMYTTIVIAGAIVLVLYVIRLLLRYFVQYYGHIIGVRMQSQMRRDLFLKQRMAVDHQFLSAPIRFLQFFHQPEKIIRIITVKIQTYDHLDPGIHEPSKI